MALVLKPDLPSLKIYQLIKIRKKSYFIQDIGEAITTAAKSNYDDDGYIFVEAANIIRFVKSYEICIIVYRRFALHPPPPITSIWKIL